MRSVILFTALFIVLACSGGDGGGGDSATWSGYRQFGESGKSTKATAVAVDPNGNIWVAADKVTAGGLQPAYAQILKYDSSGKLITSATPYTATNSNYSRAIVSDSTGSIYLAILARSSPATSDYFARIVKLDSHGTVAGGLVLPGTSGMGTTFPSGLSVDANDNVYIVGYTTQDLEGELVTGSADLFITKVNSAGTKLWTKLLGVAAFSTVANDVAIGASGDVFIVGQTSGNLDGQTISGNTDLFVTKYDSGGNKQWTRLLGAAASTTIGKSIVVDSNNNLYVIGYSTGGVDGNVLAGTRDTIVVKYDSSGNRLWTRQSGVTGALTEGTGVALGTQDEVYLTGWAEQGLDGVAPIGSVDYFLSRYDSNGNRLWTVTDGVASKALYSYGMAKDASSGIFLGGGTDAGLDGNTLQGNADGFVVKRDSSGAKK